MEKIVSLAKRRGFVFQGSEIYGGLAGFWDYGPYGVELKNNIKQLWWRMFVQSRDDMYGIDAAIIMSPRAWEASGHVGGFSDPMVECEKCHHRFRADQIFPRFEQNLGPKKHEEEYIYDVVPCPDCGGELGDVRQFNMMFETYVGAVNPLADVSAAFGGKILRGEDIDIEKSEVLMNGLDKARSFLRPETAGGIFVNFKNVMDSIHPKLPFGIAQIGKAFRNEIAPRDFIFRSREFEQMEIEYFVKPTEWEGKFEEWRKAMLEWMSAVGIDTEKVHELEVEKGDLAHYSKHTIDFEFDFPFGRKELYGLAYRTDFDLTAHQEASGQDLSYLDDATGERFVPHVIEPTLGLDRTVLAVLVSAYREDEVGGETRTYLALNPAVAPIKAAVFPLLKNKPELQEKAREVYAMLKKDIPQIMFDDNGNVGKRYRRQDEIGTPYCITIDFDTLEDDTVTVRDRDTAEQKRVKLGELSGIIQEDL